MHLPAKQIYRGSSPLLASPNSEVRMKNNIEKLKNPFVYHYVNQYVAPIGYHFMRSGINYGRIAWFSNVDGVTIEKDETE